MPTDKLTQNFQAELESLDLFPGGGSLLDTLGRIPFGEQGQPKETARNIYWKWPAFNEKASQEPYAAEPADLVVDKEPTATGGMLNALGYGLWTGLDVAGFGLPGYALGAADMRPEDTIFDPEAPGAKWLGAIGGLAGFVKGAPLKLGGLAVRGVTRVLPKAIKGVKPLADDVIGGMARIGKESGLSKKVVKEVTGGYRNLVRQAQFKPNFAKNWETEVNSYLLRTLRDGQATGKFTDEQAGLIARMFTKTSKLNVYDRPIQDIMGIITRTGWAAQNPIKARVVGHTVHDAIMFAAIDATFEGFSMIEDHEYDWTAPLWGAATGAAFGQLSWLKPKGKLTKWSSDFKVGMRAAFQTSPYKKWNSQRLEKTSKWYGELLEKYGKDEAFPDALKKSAVKNIEYGGKKSTISLNNNNILQEIKTKLGVDHKTAKNILRDDIIESERKFWGKQLMTYSTKEGLQDVLKNWNRLIMGGVVFNFRTFAEMFMHDYEPTLHDVLPHFLIGAFLQVKHKNPDRWDLKGSSINDMRSALHTLGFPVEQMSHIPSFNVPHQPWEKGVPKRVVEFAEREGIISGSNEAVSVELPEGETSVAIERNYMFEVIYDQLRGTNEYTKPMAQISTKTAEKLVKEFQKDYPHVESVEKLHDEMDNVNQEHTRQLTDQPKQVLYQIASEDAESELGIEMKDINSKHVKLPTNIQISQSLLESAEKGELEFLIHKETGAVLKGKEAIDALTSHMNGLNDINKFLISTMEAEPLQVGKDVKEIKSRDVLQSVIKSLEDSETFINNTYKDRSNFDLSFTWEDMFYNGFVKVVARNKAYDVVENIKNTFTHKSEDRTALQSFLTKAGLLEEVEGEFKRQLISNNANMDIKDGPTDEANAQAKRWLGRILALQSAAGGYKTVKDMPVDQRITIDYQSVVSLKNHLKDKRGIDVEGMPDWFQTFAVESMQKDILRKGNLNTSDIETILSLSEIGFAGFESAVEGRAAGFWVSKIDESLLPVSAQSRAREFNERIDLIVSRGKGIVKTKEVTPIGEETINSFIDAMHQVENSAEGELTTRAVLTDFINNLDKDYSSIRVQLAKAVDAGQHNTALRLLQSAKVIKSPENPGGKYAYDFDVLKNVWEKLSTDLDHNIGISVDYSKSWFAEQEDIARMAAEDSPEIKHMSKFGLTNFFTKYRINSNYGRDLVGVPLQKVILELHKKGNTTQGKEFEKLIIVDGTLREDAWDYVAERTLIDRDGTWLSLEDIDPTKSTDEYFNLRDGIYKDLTKIISIQQNQVTLTGFKWERGNIISEQKVMQIGQFHTFNRKMKLNYFPVDFSSTYFEYDPSNKFSKFFIRVNDLSGASAKLPLRQRKKLSEEKKAFMDLLSATTSIAGVDTRGGTDNRPERGFILYNPGGDAQPVAYMKSEKMVILDQFIEFANAYENNTNISLNRRTDITRIKEAYEAAREAESVVGDKVFTDALDYLQNRDRLGLSSESEGVEPGKFFEDYLSENIDVTKANGRMKLYDTKNFVFFSPEYFIELQKTLSPQDVNTINKYTVPGEVKTMLWNDEGNALVKDLVDNFVTKYGLGDKWTWLEQLGDVHNKVSAFDSIAFVSRDFMKALHIFLGHNSNSLNPLKPVISSNEGGALLYGKTVFVFSPYLEGGEKFFGKNPDVDILITKSGSKIYNEGELNPKGEDVSLIQNKYTQLNRTFGDEKKRTISLSKIGILPNEDVDISDAPISGSDTNFMSEKFTGEYYKQMYSTEVENSIINMRNIFDNPATLRNFMLSEEGVQALQAESGTHTGARQLSNLFFFSDLSEYANPNTYSPKAVRNKIYGRYIDSILNGKRAIINGTQFGGQAVIIQSPDPKYQATPSLFASGEHIHRGGVFVPNYVGDMSISDLFRNNMEIRFVQGGKILEADTMYEMLGIGMTKAEYEKSMMSENFTVSQMHDFLTEFNRTKKHNKLNAIRLGITVNTYPRTRPNDMTILGLEGILPRDYKNSFIVNNMDVLNVFEGDYDVDKMNFFWGHKKAMFDHLEATSPIYVQGIDPSEFMPVPLRITNYEDSQSRKEVDYANRLLYKASIGQVQKLPRMLNYLSHVGVKLPDDIVIKSIGKEAKDAKIIWSGSTEKGVPYRIVIDYENLDYFQRQALETQTIIDAITEPNNMFKDISSWRDEYIFPSIEPDKSVLPGELTGDKAIGFIKDARQNKKVSKRIRIFRKYTIDGELPLSEFDTQVIREMIGLYGRLLNVTGNHMWENTGKQKRAGYDDVINSATDFYKFNKNPMQYLFNKLRYKKIIDAKGNVTDRRWFSNPDFQSAFKPEWQKENKARKKPGFFKLFGRMFDEEGVLGKEVVTKMAGIADGSHGNMAERIIARVVEEDPLQFSKVDGLTGAYREIVDNWFYQVRNGILVDLEREPTEGEVAEDGRNISNATKVLEYQIKQYESEQKIIVDTTKQFNRKVALVRSLKRKIAQINSNERINFKSRRTSVDKLNVTIKELEKEIKALIPEQYWKTRRGKDLKTFNYVAISENEDLKMGAIQHATMSNLMDIAPMYLGSEGQDYLKAVKKFRQRFYGNFTTLKDVLPYDRRTTLEREGLDFLAKLPDLTTFYDIETELLEHGFINYGAEFLYEFMRPVEDKMTFGVFNGRLHPVPYQASKRYKRGMQFLSQVGNNGITKSEVGDASVLDSQRMDARRMLGILQYLEFYHDAYYNKRVELRAADPNFVRTIGVPEDVAQGFGINLTLQDIKLPSFSTDFERVLGDFKDIWWKKDTGRLRGAFNLKNDYLMQFYSDILELAGKKDVWDSYLNTMNDIQAQLLKAGTLDPMDYFAMQTGIDREVRSVARKVFTGGVDRKGNKVIWQRIRNNPVYVLMGGESFMKGLSFEKRKSSDWNRLKQISRMKKNSDRVKNETAPASEDVDKTLKTLKEVCGLSGTSRVLSGTSRVAREVGGMVEIL